jgi:four helix bundle protein
MAFHHEKLTVYQRALEFAAWSQDLIESLAKRTSTRDHLERSGDSVALNIAEGNGKFSKKDRARFSRSCTAPLWSQRHVSIFLLRDAAVTATRF